MLDKDESPKTRRIPISDGEPEPVVEGTIPAGESTGDEESDALLTALESELAEAREAHLRAVADLQNFRRRAAEERAQHLQFANEGLITELLPILDNFARATECAVEGDAAQNILRGVCMIQQQLTDVLGRFGVERMPTTGQMFDPARHDAVERVETNEVCEGTVVDEVLAGYTLHGKVVRAAKVKVAAEPH